MDRGSTRRIPTFALCVAVAALADGATAGGEQGYLRVSITP